MNVPHAAMKILCATTKAWCSQINKYINKYFKNEVFFITLKNVSTRKMVGDWFCSLSELSVLSVYMCSYCVIVHPTTYSPSCSSIAIYFRWSLASHVSRFQILVIPEFSKLIWKKIGLNLVDICYATSRASPVAQQCRRHEMWVQSLGWEDLPKEDMATHSSVLAWRIPWTEKPGGLQCIRSQRVGHDWSDDDTSMMPQHTMKADVTFGSCLFKG